MNKNFLIWAGAQVTLFAGLFVSIIVGIWVDDAQGNIDGAILPLVTGTFVFAIFMIPAAYLYGKYIIVPFEGEE